MFAGSRQRQFCLHPCRLVVQLQNRPDVRVDGFGAERADKLAGGVAGARGRVAMLLKATRFFARLDFALIPEAQFVILIYWSSLLGFPAC